jgi:hypothetical protein
MSKIKVNSIEAATGSTITIPSGQTLDISSTTLTLPSTVVTTTGTQTLTNKTIGVSQLSGTLPVANGGTGLTTLGSASQVLRVNSGATALEFGTVSSGVVKKIHTFSFDTRTAGNQSANADQFTFTASFTPLDAVNNTLYVQSIIPCDNDSNTNDAAGYGLRFTGNSTSTNYDNFGKGIQYAEHQGTMTMTNQSQFFTISANTMTNQTYTVKLRTETANSAVDFYCPNSTDHARIATQTTAYLIITEFAN